MTVAGTTRAQVVPEYMNVIVGHPATTKDELAQRDVLALNDTPMFGFYDDSKWISVKCFSSRKDCGNMASKTLQTRKGIR